MRADVGIRLPTGVVGGVAPTGQALAEAARRVEALGFDSLWCLDHLLRADYVLGAATLDPVLVLGYAAGATSRLAIGTAVLVAPIRDQLWLLKQLGTLSALAGERLLLGLGAGWAEPEFVATGVPRAERGRRLDTLLAQLEHARRTGELRCGDVEIEPSPSRWKGVYVGGGSSTVKRERGRRPEMAPAVLQRIARADGWVVRSTALIEQLRHDLPMVRAAREALGRDSDGEVIRTQFVHLAAAGSRDAAVKQQMEAYATQGWRGTREEFEAAELHGTAQDVIDQLLAYRDAGVTHFVLQPVGDVGEQIERLAGSALPALRA